MSVGIGSKSRLAFIEETVYGQFPGSPAGVELGILSETLEQTISTFVSDEIRSNRQVPAVRGGNKMAEGEVNFELSPNALGLFIEHALATTVVTTTLTATAATDSLAVVRGDYISVAAGARKYLVTRPGTLAADIVASPPTSVDNNEEVLSGTAYLQYFGAGATDIKKHVFTGGVIKNVGGFGFEKMISLGATAKYFRFVGGRVNTFNITVPQEGIVTGSMGLMFQKIDSVADATIFSGGLTSPADEPFAGEGSIVHLYAPGSATPTNDCTLSAFQMALTNNYDGNIYCLGTRFRKDLVEQRREITGSMEVWFESLTEYNYFNNESIIKIEPTFHNKGQYMKIILPMNKLSGSPTPKISGQGVVSSSYNFQTFNDGGAYDIQIELYNTTAAY